MAEKFAEKDIKKLFSSPLFRAQETAQIVGVRIKQEVIVLDNFRERNTYGILSGMKKQEAAARYPD